MSSDIAWAITRKSLYFFVLSGICPKPFSTDPMNLTNKHSQRYAGTVNKKAVAIVPASDNKGFTVSMKVGNTNKMAKSKATVTMKSGPRRSLHKTKAMIVKQRYRKDLSKAAIRKASAIIRSQKPLPARKGTKTTKKSD